MNTTGVRPDALARSICDVSCSVMPVDFTAVELMSFLPLAAPTPFTPLRAARMGRIIRGLRFGGPRVHSHSDGRDRPSPDELAAPLPGQRGSDPRARPAPGRPDLHGRPRRHLRTAWPAAG